MGIDWEFDPEKLKTKLSLESLTPGTILYIGCSFTQPQKKKYLVLICDISDPHIFLINTRPTQYIKNRPYLMKCQVLLRELEYTFLRRDSYLDCSSLIQCRRDEIENQIKANHKCIKGIISKITKRKIIEAVSKAKTISPIKKKLVIDSLN